MAKNLKRRTFLKGLGVSMALPSLEAMQSRVWAANEKEKAVRMCYIFFANGAIMPSWTPSSDGKNFEFSKTLKPLEGFKDKLNVISGLAQDNGRAKGDGAGDHARCASTFITGAHPTKTAGANIKVGVSADQYAAKYVGDRTKLPSLEIGLERGRTAGSCDSGYSCAYSSNISWKTESTPMGKEVVPRLVYDRLFGSSGDNKNKEKRDLYRKSILDLVSQDAADLKSRLGKTDQRKIDEYFSSVRELEVRIQRAEEFQKSQRPDIKLPDGVPGDFDDYMKIMYDLLVLSFQTDTTRISTYMLGNAGSNRRYTMVGVKEGHHQLSHHQNDESKVKKLQKVDQYLAEGFAYFLKKMDQVKEADGTLLDNSMIVYGSGISDANRHKHDFLPIVLAGKGGGTIKTGQHIKYSKEVPMNNLFMSMFDRMNFIPKSKIGDANGRLSEIDV